jgi:hypothetical protein
MRMQGLLYVGYLEFVIETTSTQSLMARAREIYTGQYLQDHLWPEEDLILNHL